MREPQTRGRGFFRDIEIDGRPAPLARSPFRYSRTPTVDPVPGVTRAAAVRWEALAARREGASERAPRVGPRKRSSDRDERAHAGRNPRPR